MALPFIEKIEVLITGLIAIVLLILAGARLILHDWDALRTSRNDHRPDYRLKANPKAPVKPRKAGISPRVRSR